MKVHTCPECQHAHHDHPVTAGRRMANGCSEAWCGDCRLSRAGVIAADPEGHHTSIPASPVTLAARNRPWIPCTLTEREREAAGR